ncbi:LOW QUALITY PROTEIN: uncharacterized protein EMH_0027810 [Eimeria mitis]|uniref:Uncharacterized protein n=1 Tax=Eimeria mitis TaxID=44415 RepID=U6JSB1_9EIME|nr:LOW QUALITY PROTEIN: uncharacterized protein EMH_0027810 [Eimeria mitis]CDJ26952.1 hypothetical protein EMH_0027810 [Eimeria mitis]
MACVTSHIHWVRLIIRRALFKEREVYPQVVLEWADEMLRHTRKRKTKLLMGPFIYTLKYRGAGNPKEESLRQEAADRLLSLRDSAETVILEAADTNGNREFPVDVEVDNSSIIRRGVALLKMREASTRERRKRQGRMRKDATGKTSWYSGEVMSRMIREQLRSTALLARLQHPFHSRCLHPQYSLTAAPVHIALKRLSRLSLQQAAKTRHMEREAKDTGRLRNQVVVTRDILAEVSAGTMPLNSLNNPP